MQDQIASLYGIGSHLADRIVKYRDTHGYFHGPEDLARIPGISKELATTLSPHITWELPTTKEPAKEREWFWGIFFLVIVIAFLWMLFKNLLPQLQSSLSNYSSESSVGWLNIWFDISGVAQILFVILVELSLAVSFLTIKRNTKRSSFRYALRFGFLALLSMTSLGIGNIVYYQFYSPDGWKSFLENYGALSEVASFVMCSLIALPGILILWQPTLANKPTLARVYDVGYAISAPIIGWVVWEAKDKFPLLLLVLLGFGGLAMVYFALDSIRHRKSMFSGTFYLLSDIIATASQDDKNHWLTWINTRLPDHQEQKALQHALNEAYPSSRLQTLTSIIVFGAGGWLIITAVTSIIDWLIQGWLNNLFR
jgi:hypothetical protein